MTDVAERAETQPDQQGQHWRNRIQGTGEERPDQLLANPNNYRVHPKRQQDTLLAVLREVGVVQDVIVNKNTGCVVDGHLRVMLAISEGQPTIPVKYVDLTEDEEILILSTFDPLSALAVYDRDQLAQTGTRGWDAARSEVTRSFLQELIEKNPPASLPFAPDAQAGHVTDTNEPEAQGDLDLGEGTGEPLPSHVKMVSLYFNVDTHPVFMERISALMAHYGLDNVTDVVDQAVAEAFERVPTQQVEG